MLVILGYLIGLEAGLVWDDAMLLALLGLPVLVAVPFLFVRTQRGSALRFMVGAALGLAIMVVVVFGGISLVAGMLSDPA